MAMKHFTMVMILVFNFKIWYSMVTMLVTVTNGYYTLLMFSVFMITIQTVIMPHVGSIFAPPIIFWSTVDIS